LSVFSGKIRRGAADFFSVLFAEHRELKTFP
jgi:hypothetical protein